MTLPILAKLVIKGPMQIYSETIFHFIAKAEFLLREIIVNETDIKMKRRRFSLKGYTWPIIFVVTDKQKELGHFSPEFLHIALNQKLMYLAKDKVLKDIIRHEFAHYICHIESPLAKPHGQEFKSICARYDWDDHVADATMDINKANLFEGDLDSEKVIAKIKNLLKLAQSSNIHESQLATKKANQLLIKHNIKNLNISEDQKTYVHRPLTQKRKDAKIMAIMEIVRHFLVKPILHYGKSGVSLEVMGDKMNIELADYICHYLNEELDRLWLAHKKEHNLKGLRVKNSFYRGLAHGFSEKLDSTRCDLYEDEVKSLIALSANLEERSKKIYRRLQATQSSTTFDFDGFELGMQAGNNLQIHQAVKSNTDVMYLE